MVLIIALQVRNNGPRLVKNKALDWYFLSVFLLPVPMCKSLGFSYYIALLSKTLQK